AATAAPRARCTSTPNRGCPWPWCASCSRRAWPRTGPHTSAAPSAEKARLANGNQDFGDQLRLGRGLGIVGVVLDVEVVAHLELEVPDALKHSPRGIGKQRIRPGQCEAGVLASFESLDLERLG